MNFLIVFGEGLGGGADARLGNAVRRGRAGHRVGRVPEIAAASQVARVGGGSVLLGKPNHPFA